MARQKEETFDWVNIIVPEAKKQLEIYLQREGHKPTLRSLYYILLDEGVVPGTEYGYKKLSASIVAAKKAGTFPEDAFTDTTRVTSANFRTLDKYVTPESHVNSRVEWVKNADQYYVIPRWFRQPYYVIDWIEKGTMLSIFESILQTADPPRDIPVAVNRGNSGYQKFTDRCDEIVRIVKKITTDKTYSYEDLALEPAIIIKYFGDLDPSGENMSIYLSRYLAERPSLKHLGIRLERVGINLDQVVEYDLQFAPQDLDTMQKLWADPNIVKFSRRLRSSPYYSRIIKPKLESNPEYSRLKSQIINHPKTVEQLKRRAGKNPRKGLEADPEVYQRLRAEEQRKIMHEYDFFVVEIDALAAKMQNIFRNIVLDAADEYYNQNIYDEIVIDDIHSTEAIGGLVRSKVVFLEDDPFPTYKPYLDEVKARRIREMEEWYRDRDKQKHETDEFNKRLDELNKRSTSSGSKNSKRKPNDKKQKSRRGEDMTDDNTASEE